MRRNSGHTLVEVMFAIFMLAICTLIFGSTLPAAFKSRQKADDSSVATSLAQKQLEAIRTLGYPNTTAAILFTDGLLDSATPVATNTYTFTNIDTPLVDSPASVLPDGVGRITIEDVATEMRRFTVLIQWREGTQTKSVRVATLLANV